MTTTIMAYYYYYGKKKYLKNNNNIINILFHKYKQNYNIYRITKLQL